MPFRLRFIPGWKRFLLVLGPIALAIALLVGTLAARWAGGGALARTPQANNPTRVVPSQPGLLVHVVGAVENPGLYRLPRGDRVFDAIAAAGGYSPDADMSRLPNLAGRLRDGEQVKVAFAKTASGTVIVRTNLNQATLEELEAVPGFSAAIAQDCIDYRINFGGVPDTRRLGDIPGMSDPG